MEWIYKKIWELKSKALTLENKARIQQLQQLLDGDENVSNKSTSNDSEKVDKNNSANSLKLKANSNSSKDSITNEEEEIHRFLFNRYNR
jgi:hypothetical protein